MASTSVLNYTPHEIVIYAEDDDTILHRLPPQLPGGTRLEEHVEDTHVTLLDNIPVKRISYGLLEGLPPREAGVALIVSKMVVDALPLRSDLYFPVLLVRNASGAVIGCRALAQQ